MAQPKVKRVKYRDKNSGDVFWQDGDGAPPHADCQELVREFEPEEPAPKKGK